MRNLSTGVVTTSYYLGGQLVANRVGTTLTYIHQDSLSSTSVMSTSTGTLDSSIAYFPFGSTRTGSVNTTKKFTGQRLDGTGLYYYNARYYDPLIGRFISADTAAPDLQNPQSFNKFSYCFNNPLNRNDPTGHWPNWGAIWNGFIVRLSDIFLHPREWVAETATNSLLAPTGISVDYTPSLVDVSGAPLPYRMAYEYGNTLADTTAIIAITYGTGYTVGVGGSGMVAVEDNSATTIGRTIDNSNNLGRIGEKASGLEKNTEQIMSLTGTANFRIPDGLDKVNNIISEVKNVQYQSYTNQIKDYLMYSQYKGYTFELWTRPDTVLSNPLQNLIESGDIIQKYIYLNR